MDEIEITESGVIIHQLKIESVELAEYLGDLGEPSEGIKELIDIAMTVRSRFSTGLETQNIRDSADSVIERMEEVFEQMVKVLKEKADLLVDPEQGPVIKALDKATGDNLKKLLAPESTLDQSPIARLRGMIADDISAFKDDVDGALLEIKGKLGIGVQKRKSGADGTDFETKIDGIIQSYATIYGDTAIATGAKAESGAAKKGDTEVELNYDDTGKISCKIIWESKTDARFKGKSTTQSPKVLDDQVKLELNAAMDLRKAKSGVLVLDTSSLDMDAQPTWREYEGNKLLIVVDPITPDEDLIRLAYLWSRWKAKASLGTTTVSIDFDGIRNSFDQIRLRLKDLRNVKKAHTDVNNLLSGASSLVTQIQKDTKRMMEELAETINIELAEVSDDED